MFKYIGIITTYFMFNSFFYHYDVSSLLKLAFIGYCGFNPEDAIALDNISVNVAIDPSATTPVVTSPPTQETTTLETSTELTTTPSTTETIDDYGKL